MDYHCRYSWNTRPRKDLNRMPLRWQHNGGVVRQDGKIHTHLVVASQHADRHCSHHQKFDQHGAPPCKSAEVNDLVQRHAHQILAEPNACLCYQRATEANSANLGASIEKQDSMNLARLGRVNFVNQTPEACPLYLLL